MERYLTLPLLARSGRPPPGLTPPGLPPPGLISPSLTFPRLTPLSTEELARGLGGLCPHLQLWDLQLWGACLPMMSPPMIAHPQAPQDLDE